MRFNSRTFVWVSVGLLLLSLSGLAWAATEADVRYIKAKIEAGEMLSAADISLAKEINATTGSYIDIDLALERAKAIQAGVRETPRRGGNSLDNFGGPDAFGYSYRDNVAPDTATYEWIELRGDPGATWISNWASYDDGCASSAHDIGFSFPFYGNTYTTFTPTSNGWIEFGTCSPYSYYSCIPQTVWGPAVVPWAYDMHLQRGGDATGNNVVGYRNFGDYTVIEFDSIGYYSSTYTGSSLKYQIILYNTGRIKLQYNNIVLVGDPEMGTVGIQDPSTAGYNLPYRCSEDDNGVMPITNELAIWFYQPDGIPVPVTDLEANQVGADVVLTWRDPDQDTYGNPIVVDSLVVHLGAVRLGRVNAGVQTFTHPNAPDGNLTYSVTAYNDGYGSSPTNVGIVVGSYGYFNDFEDNDGGWESSGGWERGIPTGAGGPTGAYSGANCWGTVLSGNYANNACYNLDLDMGLVVMDASATVEFWAWFDTEASYDGCNFKVSLDGGGTWEVVTPTDGYPGSTNSSQACMPSQPAWTGHDIGEMWHYVVIPVGQYVGLTPIFRFQFGSDGSVQYPGYFIDDLIMWGVTLPSGMPRPVTDLTGDYVAPNAVLTWTDPTLDTDGNPIQIENVQVWWGPVNTGILLATVNPGVQTYTHVSPPAGIHTYNVRPFNDPYFGLPMSVDVVVGTPTYLEGFEVSDGMWVPDPATGGWEWGTPSGTGPGGAHEGHNCWGTVLSGNYANSACWHVDLDLGLVVESPTATVEFWAWYSTETSFDGCHLKASLDGGATWELVTPDGGYPQPSVSSNPCIGTSVPSWAGNSNGWIYVVVPVGQYLGEAPIFRFTFGSDPSVNSYPGFYFDDMVIWGLAIPQGADVSGTVTLNGGTGNVTGVTVRANGIGNPNTHPAANGTYTLVDVQVGDRIITAELAGYVTQNLPLTVPEEGVTGFDIMLNRTPPPAPTNLTGSVDAAGLVTLDWDNSPDAEVDRWYVYRKLREDQTWVYQFSVASSNTTQQLASPGIWWYAVTAVDSVGPLAPVESERSANVELLYGELPPQMLTANGNFDDHIHLSWFEPGTPPEFELFYDDEENDVDGIGWWSGEPTFGWLVAHYQGDGPVTVTRVKQWFTSFTGLGDPIQVGLFADNGSGQPTFTPLGVIDAVQGDEPLDAWREWEIDPPLTFNDGSFFVGARQIAAFSPVALGGDEDNPFMNNTFFGSYDATTWNTYESWSLFSIPMQRCFAIGTFGELVEMSPSPVQPSVTELDLGSWGHVVGKRGGKPDFEAIYREMIPTVKENPTVEDAERNVDRLANATGPRAPFVEAGMASSRDGRRSLDQEVEYYIVYRDGTDHAHVPVPATTYDDMVAEGIEYDYHITAWYDNDVESGPTATVSAMAAMAPGAPQNVTGASVNSTQIRIEWTDPTVNADGTPCVDLAGIRVYRNEVLLTTLAPGVGEYIDTPPQPNMTYQWLVRGFDEVPNEGPAGTFTGSVVLPWMEGDYDWVDITGVGISTGITGDDQNAGPFNLGFPFTYYGNNYTSIRVCGNGWLSFTSTVTTYSNTAIPNTAEPNNALYPFWDDLYPPAGGQILYYADAANQRFIVSWEGIEHIGGTEPMFFQVILGADGSVKYQYHTIPESTPGNTSCTVGLENATGTDAFQVWLNGAGEFAPVSESAVEFWGPPPVYANVSGAVTLDGGAGLVTDAVVRANGVSRPSTHPAGDGTYTLQDVQVGNRTFWCELDGYHTVSRAVAVPEEGLTNENFTLRRVNPPAPTNLTASVNSGTGEVTLNWDDSPDLLVDAYRLYRKLREDTEWVLRTTIVGRTNSQTTETLTESGIYQYQVTAIDNDVVAPPVESAPSAYVEALYGELPPQMLTANGNFDNRIVLQWLEPGTPPEVELYYDSSDVDYEGCVTDGLGFTSQFPFAWFAGHYQTAGTVTVTRIRTRHWPNSTPGCPVQYGVFEDAGGQPTLTPLGVTDWTIQSPTEWQDCELQTPVTVSSGSFYVGIRQMTAQRVDIGMDFCATPQANTFFAVTEAAGPWTELGSAGFPQVLVMRAVVMGNVAAGAMELSPTPVEGSQTSSWPVAKAPGSRTLAKSGRTASVTTDETEGTEKVPEVPAIMANTTSAEIRELYATPGIAAMRAYGESDRDRETLDEVLRYIIYRGGVAYDSVAATLLTYTDNGHGAGLPENTQYQYAVRARYDNNAESSPSNTVTASCNMAPGVPTSVQGTPVGTSQMRILWADPTVNRDGSPCVDLAGIKVYRNGTFLADVNAGVGQYLDTPPQNDQFYTWEVKAFDEVPNVGDGASFIGAVQSPWRVVDIDWVDITGVGTNTGITGDDQNAGPFTLGFNFEFYGNTYNSIRVCSNGWLSFTSTVTTYSNTAIPATAEPNNALYPFWDDLYPPSGGNTLYYADAANQRFIVTWNGIEHISGTEPLFFQVILTARGSITYQYQTISTTGPGNTSCTVGVENATGTDAIQLVYNGTGPFLPTSGTAVEFWGGPSGHLEGIVRAFGSNLPIENARVWAEGWADTAYTDALGSYAMDLDPETYTLHVDHIHYCGETYQVVIEDNVTTVRNAVLRAPQAQVSVSSFNVEVMQNLTRIETFTISNNGGQCPLTFSITDTAAWLSASPATGTVDANQSQEIQVTFAPGSLPVGSDRQAALVVNYNAAGTPSIINCFMHVLTVTELGGAVPTEFAFRGNYPNPFNPVTHLRFDVPQQSRVDLVIYNVMGQEVARPVSDVFQAGRYEASFDAGDLPSGMYLVRMTAGDYSAMGKMMLLK